MFAIRGHLQLLEVNSRTFQPKNVLLQLISDIVLLMALKMVTILVIIARHVPWVNTVSRCTETPLRPDITPLYET